ncbi:MFS transporter [Saccharopolyspora sp. NPDC049357]|uniref:MFS transporter n=1 Tax=Saccharopolyspora sp. NPDC049357 TaxID=3154507 RepID=UPI003432DB87
MRSRHVLLTAAGLHMVTETALAPFYPELFRAAFGVHDLAATGWFVGLSRIAAILALPLWGLATRRWRMEHLVLCGQSIAVVLTGCLALAPSWAVFTAIGVALVAAKAVVLLAYPATARTHPEGLLSGVRQYVAVLQIAIVAASGLGALIVSAPDPTQALPLLAVVEGVLLVVCAVALRSRRATGEETTVKPADVVPLTARVVLPTAVLVLGFHLAGNVVRPYFTEYSSEAGFSEFAGALLFVVAHLAALVAVKQVRTRPPGLVVPFAVAAAGLVLQAVTADPLLLALGRAVFGAGLGLGQVALDVRVLTTTRGSEAVYGLIAAAQHTALLSAPLIATAGATWDLAVPLATGAGLFAVLAVTTALVPTTLFHPRSSEVSDVPVRTR